jgi:hypothetical protein
MCLAGGAAGAVCNSGKNVLLVLYGAFGCGEAQLSDHAREIIMIQKPGDRYSRIDESHSRYGSRIPGTIHNAALAAEFSRNDNRRSPSGDGNDQRDNLHGNNESSARSPFTERPERSGKNACRHTPK